MKECEEFAPLLSAFVDGELTEERVKAKSRTNPGTGGAGKAGNRRSR